MKTIKLNNVLDKMIAKYQESKNVADTKAIATNELLTSQQANELFNMAQYLA